jgi:hypothetical protein
MVQRHLSLITGRIVFTPQLLPDVPVVTPRVDFDLEDLKGPEEMLVSDDEPEGELSALSSMDTDESESEGDGKIPKPLGEAGRPGSGGYNLKDVLGWTKSDFDKIQVRELCATHSTKTNLRCVEIRPLPSTGKVRGGKKLCSSKKECDTHCLHGRKSFLFSQRTLPSSSFLGSEAIPHNRQICRPLACQVHVEASPQIHV